MEIIGYSERGAMNALFYGIALDKNLEDKDEPIRRFLQLAGVEENFTDFGFELYSEFSLSEFGNPDMIIIAKKKDNQDEKVVFFIEAKASCCKYYDLEKQKDYHDGTGEKNGFLTTKGHKDGHSSNLFFQLRLKHYFFTIRSYFWENVLEEKQKEFFDQKGNGFSNYDNKNGFILGRNGNRKIGENVVVRKMVEKLQDCETAYYIAIIPKQIKQDEKEVETNTNDYIRIDNNVVNKDKVVIKFGFDKEPVWKAYVITWEEIYHSEFGDYIKDTIEFNQNKNEKGIIVNQILNNV